MGGGDKQLNRVVSFNLSSEQLEKLRQKERPHQSQMQKYEQQQQTHWQCPGPDQIGSSGEEKKVDSEGDDTDYRLAIKLANDAIERGTDLHDAYYERSICYYRLKEYEQSLKDVDVAIDLQPDNYEYHLQKSYVLFAMVRRREARDSIKRAIHLRAAMPSTRLQDLYNMIIHAIMDKNSKNKDTNTTSSFNTTTEPVTDDDNNFKETTNYNESVASKSTDNTICQQGSDRGIINSNPTKLLMTKNRIFTTKGQGTKSNQFSNDTVDNNTAIPIAGSSNIDDNSHNDINDVNLDSKSSYPKHLDTYSNSRIVNDERQNLVGGNRNNITRNDSNGNSSNNNMNINNTKNNLIKSYQNNKNSSNNDKCKTNNNINYKQSSISNNFKKTQYLNTSDTVPSTAIYGTQQQDSLSTMLISQMMSTSDIASVNKSMNPSSMKQIQNHVNHQQQQHINNLNINRDNYQHQQLLSQADHDNVRRSERIFLSSPIVSPPVLPRTNSVQNNDGDTAHLERSTKRPRTEECVEHQKIASSNYYRQYSMSDASDNGDSDIDVDDSSFTKNNNEKIIVHNTQQPQQNISFNTNYNNNNNIAVSKLPQNLKPGMSIAIVPINPAPAITVTAGTATAKDDGASYSTKYKRLRRDRERARRGTCKLCIISPDDLIQMQQEATTKTMRVIAPIEQWLYSGELSVDSDSLGNEIPRFIVRLDGDPAKHPFIFSRDSILDNVIREVHVKSVSELRKGARICCYWNKDLSCLATGVVTSRTFEATKSLVSVKYDNGGLSALSLDDLRLLPPDYPKFVSQNNIALAGRFSTHFKNHNGPNAPGLCTKSAASSLKNIHEQLEQYQQEHKQPTIQKQQHQQKTTKLIMMKVIPSQPKSQQVQNVNQNTESSGSKQTQSHHSHQQHHSQIHQYQLQQPAAKQVNEQHVNAFKEAQNDPAPSLTDNSSNNTQISQADKSVEDEVDAYTFVDSHQDIVKDAIDQVNKMRCVGDDYSSDNSTKNASKKPTINDLIIKIKRDKSKNINIESKKDVPEKSQAKHTVATVQHSPKPPPPVANIPTTETLINFISRDNEAHKEFIDDQLELPGQDQEIEKQHEEQQQQIQRYEDEFNHDDDKESLGDGRCNRLEIVDEEASESVERQIQEVQDSLVSSLVEETANSEMIPTSDDSVASIYSLPASDQSHLWPWHFEGPPKKIKRNGRAHKYHYRSIRRGNEILSVGDAAELLPKDKKTLPFIAKIDSFWATGRGEMKVLVRWYYRLGETKGPDPQLEDGQNAVFESAHPDINDIRSIHKAAKILSWTEYKSKYLGHINDDSPGPKRNIYYIAGYYDPTVHTKTLRSDVV